MSFFRLISCGLVFAICLCCCSNSDTVVDNVEPDLTAVADTVADTVKTDTSAEKPFVPEGMVQVQASGDMVQLKDLSLEYSRSLWVRFSYDFYMGVHEVTCAEMERDCKDSLPVTDVTYCDAVLFANAKSKKAGLDTAYAYTKLSFDESKACVAMDGLVFHPEVNAYRLPTEAEWVYVANRGWKPEKSWHNGNSDYELHKVCTSFVDSLGVCDMAGNAMEWVNDWLTAISDTMVWNYVGASDGGGLGERVLKGGSFRNASATMTPYSRGDIYTVTSASRADYVGFRLAYGAIENPVWLDRDGGVASSVISVLASSEQIRNMFGTYNAKLVFRDDMDGNLVFIDYAAGNPRAVRMRDTIDSFHPDISPDGRRVAFCTGLEGVRGKSSLYVRNLDSAGSGLVRLDVKNASIPRWRILENGDTAIVYVNDAGDNKNESAFGSASTWQVVFAGGKFGKPKKLFDGAYHGGVSGDGRLAVSGARLLRARVVNAKTDAARDTVWYNGEQACNVSLSGGDAKRTLFLDFASKSGKEFTRRSYDAHEIAFIADSTGRLDSYAKAPTGYTFDHTEWVSGSDSQFVATLMDAYGRHERIVLVNSRDAEEVPLLEGQELWHPALWVNAEKEKLQTALDPDSTGRYFVDGKPNHLLAQKMPMFWHVKDSIEIAVLGNSRMHYGINPEQLKGYYAFNFAFIPCDINAAFFMLLNYLLPHCPKLKYVLVGIDPDMWWVEDPDWNIGDNINDVPGFFYDVHHNFWGKGLPEGFIELVDANRRFDSAYDMFKDNRGWQPLNGEHGWDGDISATEIVNDTTDSDLSAILQQELDRLEEFVNYAKGQGVMVIGITSPMCPCYKKTGAYGRYGLRRSQAGEAFEKIRAYDEREENFVFLDENKMGDHDYSLDMGFDFDHINAKGSSVLSARVDSLLRTLE